MKINKVKEILYVENHWDNYFTWMVLVLEDWRKIENANAWVVKPFTEIKEKEKTYEELILDYKSNDDQ